MIAVLIAVRVWTYLYMPTHGGAVWIPAWIEGWWRVYTALLNRSYAEELYQPVSPITGELIHRIDKLERG